MNHVSRYLEQWKNKDDKVMGMFGNNSYMFYIDFLCGYRCSFFTMLCAVISPIYPRLLAPDPFSPVNIE